jgi:hypothetical protein
VCNFCSLGVAVGCFAAAGLALLPLGVPFVLSSAVLALPWGVLCGLSCPLCGLVWWGVPSSSQLGGLVVRVCTLAVSKKGKIYMRIHNESGPWVANILPLLECKVACYSVVICVVSVFIHVVYCMCTFGAGILPTTNTCVGVARCLWCLV